MRMTWRSAVCVGTRNLSNGQTNFSERKKGRSAGGAAAEVCPFWMRLLEGGAGAKSPSRSERDGGGCCRDGCRMSVSRSTTICRVFPWYLRLPACRCSHHRHRHGTIDEESPPSPCPHGIHVPLSSPSMEHSFHTRIRFLKESRSPMTFLLSYYSSSFSLRHAKASCDLRSRFHSNWFSNQDGRSRQYLVHQTLFLLSNCFADVLDSETLSRNLSVSPPSYYVSSSSAHRDSTSSLQSLQSNECSTRGWAAQQQCSNAFLDLARLFH
mmetsp:Transcript_25384/g.51257  ORF Transcript_25384/g.51257 Transcript_25384/m.51257 type:complete len:267 (-) Transcript_25384:568-1368(-)